MSFTRLPNYQTKYRYNWKILESWSSPLSSKNQNGAHLPSTASETFLNPYMLSFCRLN